MAEPVTNASVNPWVHIARVRFFWLLVALMAFILAAPALPNSSSGQFEIMVLIILIFFAASYVSQGLNRFRAIMSLSVAMAILVSAYIYFGYSTGILLGILAVVLVTLVYTAVCVLSFVLRGGDVETEHIFGAICAYVLIAMAFATVYFGLELCIPGSFTGGHFADPGERPWWQFFYFSFTTLSTVGYGDLVATSMRARSFVIIEQLVAVFYVAILISRLTGMYKTGTGPKDLA